MKKYQGLLGKSEEISFTKFVACYLALMRFTENEDFVLVLKSFFNLLDEDGDGLISAEDITDVCCDARLPLQISRWFIKSLSSNGDSRINFTEFRKLFAIDQYYSKKNKECPFSGRIVSGHTLDF